MEPTNELTTSRVRSLLRGTAGPLELGAVVTFAVAVWVLSLGWDWSIGPTAPSVTRTYPQSSADWVVLGAVAMVAVAWLALRGRAIVGTVAVCLPIAVLSGWRMAAAGVIGWPTGLASLVFALSGLCMLTAIVGAWLRHRGER
jgi:hypothetical protein